MRIESSMAAHYHKSKWKSMIMLKENITLKMNKNNQLYNKTLNIESQGRKGGNRRI